MSDAAGGTRASEHSRAPAAPQDVRVAIWPVIIVIYATLLPREMRFYVGGLAFYADRVGLILVLPYIVKKLIDGAIRFVLPDVLMLFTGAWMILSMIAHYGWGGGLASGGSLALDATAAYFLARISFRSLTDVRRALVVLVPGFALVGAIMMIESVSHRLLIRPFMASVFGTLPFFLGGEAVASDLRDSVRLGLLRAYGPFVHPIVGGLYLASLLGIYSFSGLTRSPRLGGMFASAMAIFTVSSAAIAGLGLTLLMMTFEVIQRRVRELRWSHVFVAAAIAWIVIDLVSKSGAVSLLIRFISLDPATAYYRTLIWQFAGASVWVHPWVGIGFQGYDRPVWMVSESIDAHWLLLAVRFGLPVAIAQGTAVLVAIWALSNASVHASGRDQLFYRGIAISLSVLTIMMFTVTLWGGTLSWFNLLLGGAVACAQKSYRLPFPLRESAARTSPV